MMTGRPRLIDTGAAALMDVWALSARRAPNIQGLDYALLGRVSVRLTPAAYAHGLALALPEKVELARPTGVGHALATLEIPIEGRDEWLAAARRLA
jgi:hypothetical protein